MNPILKVAFTANLFEWYEFSLTAFMALEIGRLFFPATDDKAALMLSFSVFASSYLARPVGSVFFGYFSHTRGTGSALKWSMVGMAVPAALIAFLPTYESVGSVATALLLGLKIIQGFCAGGELPLTGYFVSLNTPQKYRGVYCAVSVASGFFGMLLASGVVLVLPHATSLLSPYNSMVPANYIPDAWRWPFLICIPLSVFVYLIRASINDGQRRRTRALPRQRPMVPLLQAFSLVAFMEIVIYALFVWMPAYLHAYLGVSESDAGTTNTIALFVFSISMIGVGYLARFVDSTILVFTGMSLISVACMPLFIALQNASLLTLISVQVAFGILASCVVGVIFVVLPDLFRDNWGSFGMVVTYSVATAMFGGTAPIVCAYLINATQLLTAPALYILVAGMVATPVAYNLMRRRGRWQTASTGDILTPTLETR